jgi:hypothetical protein
MANTHREREQKGATIDEEMANDSNYFGKGDAPMPCGGYTQLWVQGISR